ncbi:MAG TPA: hypothetical protein VH165_13725 [Kofleriaceae bacterium]|nr:hypothetical protein [Kofleriaceae bacterium]
MTRRPALLFRADASHGIGFGHVARLASLIEELAALGPHGADPIAMFGGESTLVGWLANYGILATTDPFATAAPTALHLPVNENSAGRRASTATEHLGISDRDRSADRSVDRDRTGERTPIRRFATSDDLTPSVAAIRSWTTDDVIAAASDSNVRAVVIDGPPLAEALVPALDARGIRTIVLDDRGDCMLPADLVINHNHHAPGLAGSYPKARRLLLGRKYLMLRRTLRRLGRGACFAGRSVTRASAARLRVAISFGGSDPVGATVRTLRMLPSDRPLHVVAIAGPGFRDGDALYAAAYAAIANGHSVEIVEAPDEPGEVFATAHAAICSAGGTLGELAYLGCPAFACAITPDQIIGARVQVLEGLIAGGGNWAELSDDKLRAELRTFLADDARRNELAARALATTDGEGPRRILTDLLG